MRIIFDRKDAIAVFECSEINYDKDTRSLRFETFTRGSGYQIGFYLCQNVYESTASKIIEEAYVNGTIDIRQFEFANIEYFDFDDLDEDGNLIRESHYEDE